MDSTSKAVEKFFDNVGPHTGHLARGDYGWFSMPEVSTAIEKHKSSTSVVLKGLTALGVLERVQIYIYPRRVFVYRKVATKWSTPHANIFKAVKEERAKTVTA